MSEIHDIAKDCNDYLDSLKELVYILCYKNKDTVRLSNMRQYLANLDEDNLVINRVANCPSWRVKSESNKGTYTITKTSRNKYSCSCNHYLYTRTECKHIKQLKKDLLDKAVVSKL